MRPKPSKHSFIKDLRVMMYGFGDTESPRTDTAIVVQDYLLHYLTTILLKTKRIGRIKGKIKTEDLLFVIRKDKRKIKRVKELLKANEKLLRARKAFDFDEIEKE